MPKYAEEILAAVADGQGTAEKAALQLQLQKLPRRGDGAGVARQTHPADSGDQQNIFSDLQGKLLHVLTPFSGRGG